MRSLVCLPDQPCARALLTVMRSRVLHVPYGSARGRVAQARADLEEDHKEGLAAMVPRCPCAPSRGVCAVTSACSARLSSLISSWEAAKGIQADACRDEEDFAGTMHVSRSPQSLKIKMRS
eukprot:1730040-Pleurochrysis_carterae.AAC.3